MSTEMKIANVIINGRPATEINGAWVASPPPEPTWYAINKVAASPDEAEVCIYDAIGAFGITAAKFIGDLKHITAKTLNVRINTPGGEIFDGTAIYNALCEHPARVVIYVDGVAASAGSFIAMSGDEVRMADNAYLMIHNARGGVMGQSQDMRRYADTLDDINDNIAGMYEKKTGKPKQHWRGLMSAETWFTAEEAKAEGLADTIYDSGAAKKKMKPVKCAFDTAIYNKIPNPVREMWGLQPAPIAPVPETKSTPPEVAPSGEPSSALPQENSHMANESAQALPATTPAAVTNGIPQGNTPEIVKLNQSAIQNYIEQGRNVGRLEGRKEKEDEFRQLRAACPDRHDLVCSAFESGQSIATLKLIRDAEMRAETIARSRQSELEVENARLQAQLATGGHQGVNFALASERNGDALPQGLEPEQQAKYEWDSDPSLRAKHHNNEKAFMLYRVNVLKGNVRVLSKA